MRILEDCRVAIGGGISHCYWLTGMNLATVEIDRVRCCSTETPIRYVETDEFLDGSRDLLRVCAQVLL
jgi:hypothetical protein